ncbi:YdiU domain protein [Lasiosphaeria miniovina]|uniref:Selenoprotein O n=1 Tax=Lasiosphaeria miniovina TaxID=1954250 RepID=A0AA39ZZK5_9PEZI|nr:YdiU domain protein [Lasiosphaeria miniovina]KAK0706558.1 YdiU domain protein [Lasiosphaeria miniovina]
MGDTAANGSSPSPHRQTTQGTTLAALPKSWHFTASLPADPMFPTPADSHKTPRDEILARQVRGALFTWVRPEQQKDPELLAVSPAAMRDLGLALSEAATGGFRQTAAGNRLHGWDEESGSGGYPWAQCYGGFQFGDWAGQLGDGRAISLFEATNPTTNVRNEVQLKGAGMTPYSRFADGKAVLRSSIREFVVSEYLHALGIPTTRALALTLLPHSRVRRETVEPGAIVVRFAQTWLRFGTFDLLRARGDRPLLRRLATYVAEDVFGGWDRLPARLEGTDVAKPSEAAAASPGRGVPANELQGPAGSEENRFARLFREIVRRNALTVAKWQAYGFMNGVLNTDNTSVFGLSMDYGPFAFMDNFDPTYTPNHDDHFLRYSYRNQPTIIWWNLVRLAEALGELLGAGGDVDDATFVAEGVKDDAAAAPLVARAEKLIDQAGEEYKTVFLGEYKRLMAARLGLRTQRPSDFDDLFSSLLDTLEALELDFNLFFRRLSTLRVADLATPADRETHAARFFYADYFTSPSTSHTADEQLAARRRVADWLDRWRDRVIADWGTLEGWGSAGPESAHGGVPPERDAERIAGMKAVNPNFVPRGWVLDELIRRVEKDGERDVLRRVVHMALHPFEDVWTGQTPDDTKEGGGGVYQGDADEEVGWTTDVPRKGRAMQCSCSS